ncbi:MAG TPA: hypothetical protein VKZ95_02380 [Sphingobacteriaceae bacterium]|nr:hypothetical protein [Sphingobacteriaceae bacterium]
MLKIKIIIGLFTITSLFSCVESEPKVADKELFFSLKNYFEKEAQRLNKIQPTVLKQVNRNSTTETKEIEIQDWEREFGLFIESDINRLSWKNSYLETTRQDTVFYKSNDPTLRTQEIYIVKDNDKIKGISINNIVDNYLYKSNERLVYYPDSLYQINKLQKVRVLGANDYHISGFFK